MTEPGQGGSEQPAVVWFCEHCTKQVGTDGDEPDECPTCGNTEWKTVVDDRSAQAGADR